MPRLRKASRAWHGDAPAAAARVTVECEGPYFMVEPAKLFGRDAPLEVEIGAGRGDFIIERAQAAPARNFLAIELARSVSQLMAVRAGRCALGNLRVVRMDARSLVNLMLPDGAVSAYHIYFPDPWPKERHAKHRLFTPAFVAGLRRTLARGAPLYFATDVAEYAEAIFAMLADGGFVRIEGVAPGAEATGFARKFRAAGIPLYSGAFAVRE